jgi:metal transporter CNNM
MAMVIPAPDRPTIGNIILPKQLARSPETACWTGTQRTNERIKSRLRRMNAQPESANNFLDGALAGIENKDRRHNVTGVRCPEPLGIVTFEDIVDMILQQTSRDERDFYHNPSPRTWGSLVGDRGTVSMTHEVSLISVIVHILRESTALILPESLKCY